MMKKFSAVVLAAIFTGTAIFAAPVNAKAQFDAAVSQVDMGGEMLYYQNTQGIQKLFDKIIPQVLQAALKDQPMAPMIIQSNSVLLQLINLQAIRAFAVSSREINENLYQLKAFTLLDRQAKSLLIDPAVKNYPIRWQDLPADTIVAVKGNIDLAYIWQLINFQMQNSPDPATKALLSQIIMLAQTSGIDGAALLGSINGEFQLLITGSDLKNPEFMLSIPDKNGLLTNMVKSFCPPENNSGMAVCNLAEGIDLQVIYTQGSIILASSEALLKKPAKTLSSLPDFQKLNYQLPKNGNAVAVINISGELLRNISGAVKNILPETAAVNDLLTPVYLLAVQNAENNGEKLTVNSNFSIPQLQQSISIIAPAASTLLPALNSARERARSTTCLNNMKQFATACFIYANDNGGKYPVSKKELLDKKLITEEIAVNIIFLAPGLNIDTLTNGASYPVAICNRFNHDDTVSVLLADGHVEGIAVPPETDDRGVIAILAKRYNLPPEQVDSMLKAVTENE